MLLLTQAQKNKLLENHKAQDGTKEFKAVVKLFNPTGIGTWYLTEYDPVSDMAFGLCNVGVKEIGYAHMKELREFKGRFVLGIERDKYFDSNKKTMEECKAL